MIKDEDVVMDQDEKNGEPLTVHIDDGPADDGVEEGTERDARDVGEEDGVGKEEDTSDDTLLEGLRNKHAELEDKYLRLGAEFENYKKRMEKEKSEVVRYCNERFMKELLQIIDNLKRAVGFSNQETDQKSVKEGVSLTLDQFLKILGKFGLEGFSSKGEPFDPCRHEAVMQMESDEVAENHVVDEFQEGYFLHGRLLRPAQVSVAVKPKAPEPDDVASTDEGAP